MKVCHFCSRPLPDGTAVYRSSICPYCDKDLKICLNCRFFRKGAHWDCLESIAESVADKDRANFCDFFQFKESQPSSQGTNNKTKAKEDFDRLFGGM